MSAADYLDKAAETFRERGKLYGDNYVRAGNVMLAMFPQGIKLDTARDQTRYHLMSWIVGKLCRYAVQWEKGHADSIHDATVYCALLEDFDESTRV